MSDHEKTKEQLVAEVIELRQRLESAEAGSSTTANDSRFRPLVEKTSDVIWELDENNRLTYVSPKVGDFLGYAPGEVTGKTPFDLMPAIEAERMEGVIAEIIKSRRPIGRLESIFLHEAGHEVVFETSGEPITDAEGNTVGFRGVSRDVTDRKKAEAALRQSEEQYRQIFESIADSVFVGDLHGNVAAANPAACKAHGYTREEIVGLPVKMLIAPAERHRLDEFLEAVETGTTFRVESVEMRKDGSTFDVDVYGRPFIYKGSPHLLAIVRDISERKKAEKEVRQSEETARALINASTESEFLVELDGTIVTLNETAASRMGKTVEELIGQCGYDFMPPELAETRRGYCREVVRTGRPCRTEDERMSIVFDSCIYPVFDASGRVVRLAIYAQDVTERKAAEEAAQKERRHLQHSLEASDRERRLIAYDIHDGLAQYLSAAIMQFQTSNQMQPEDSDGASAMFDAGMKLLRHAMAETRRLIGGVRPPILDEMGIVAAVEHLVNGIRGKGGPEIDFDADVRFRRLTPSVENSLFRIIQEGLANACIHSDSEKVRLSLTQDGTSLRVEVQDWGIGFDVNTVREGSFGVEGIRERARLLGGTATFASQPGKGTRVLVELSLPEEA